MPFKIKVDQAQPTCGVQKFIRLKKGLKCPKDPVGEKACVTRIVATEFT